MRNRPINWTEGMFLRPQHFQAADRYWHEIVATSDQFDHAYNYGILNISVNEPALANFQLEIVGCQARLRDGTIVSFEADRLDRVDLRHGLKGPEGLQELFVNEDAVTVYLAVPKIVDGRANVAQVDQQSTSTRYVAYEIERDEESEGGDRQPISLRDVNVRILLSTDDLQGYDCLPLLRLRQSALDESSLVLDEDYFPPCLAIQAWPDLYIKIVRAIYDKIGEQADKLAALLVNRDISWSSRHPGDLEKMYQAGVLSEALGTLNCLSFGQGVHPFLAYTALCQIIGRLSILGPEKRAPDFPRYDHDDLAQIFKWALRTIERLLFQMPDELVEQRWFIGAGRNMQVSMDPKWFTKEWDLFVGIRAGAKSVEECERVLRSGESGDQLDCRFGSIEEVDEIFRDRKQGVKLNRLKQTPSPLADRGNWLFFSISEENEYWQHVQLTNSLAIRIRDEQIYNLKQLDKQREIVLQLGGQLIGLEFAVFAVRKRL